MHKIIRSIAYFSKEFNPNIESKLAQLKSIVEDKGFEVQTNRICIDQAPFSELFNQASDKQSTLLSSGTLTLDQALDRFDDFKSTANANFNIELAHEEITKKHVEFIFKIFNECPEKTFNFTYVFNNAPNSPYYPSASYEKEGFSIGLQPTDLSEGCNSLQEWLENMKKVWDEIHELFKDDPNYLGIDTSIAPLFEKDQSFVYFIKRIAGDFSQTFTSDIYSKVTKFIKEEYPKPVGLCGLMMPCLEDFELAREYENGNFDIERNIFVSLHSGLGIDTYPMGIDEDPKRVLDILKLVQALSNKYEKPLSARFVSDGKAKIGEKSNFGNQYLYDVVIRAL